MWYVHYFSKQLKNFFLILKEKSSKFNHPPKANNFKKENCM